MNGNLPPGWTWAQGSELFQIIRGVTYRSGDSSHEERQEYAPLLRATNIQASMITLNDMVWIPKNLISSNQWLRSGDIIVATSSGSLDVVGKAAKINAEIASRPIAFGAFCAVLRPLAGIEPSWSAWYLRTNTYRHWVRNAAVGININNLRASTFEKFPIPIPSLPEQHRIAARIEALFARIQRVRADLEQIEALAKRYKEQLLITAFSGELETSVDIEDSPSIKLAQYEPPSHFENLPELPPHWQWAAMDSLGKIAGGVTKNQQRSSLPVAIPYLRVANVYADELRLETIETICITEAEKNRVILKPGDLLVVEGNGSVEQIGRVAIWDGSIPYCGHQNHLIRIRPRSEIPSRYLLHWLMSPYGRHVLETVASSSSGLHTLSLSKIAAIPVPIPPKTSIAVQITDKIDEAQLIINKAQHEATHALALLDHLEQSILAKAFRGELVPQDYADKPVEELLTQMAGTSPKPRRRG